jgi:rhodanese-related sulfurtransferase
MSQIEVVSTDELARRLAQGGVFQFWNVLTAEYFKGDLIPGSLHVPLDQLGREVARVGLPKDAEIIVYCAGPKCPASRQAAEKLGALGYTNARAYEGGLEAWSASGRALTRFEAAVAA